ncbi:hypothetical protein [Demequina sp. NBRC 110055]|uniref:hypothetical protein n=1 Tax=Demequina sp. NBRC 110055 TaxID=1570344 RepID=UPI001F1770D8|nr:hypothetical protein [Demequina sp. NBRC 110055]
MPTYRSVQWSYQNTLAATALIVSLIAVVVLFFVADGWSEAPWLAWITIAVLVAPLFIPMVIEVGTEGIRVRLAGLTVRTIALEDVVAVERRDYKPLREFGGWGLRWGITHRHARAYSTTGTSAVVLTLRDGQEVYLGVADEPGLMDTLRLRTEA